VTPTGLRPYDLARGGKLETLGHGFFGFTAGDGFWHGGWTITESTKKGNKKKVDSHGYRLFERNHHHLSG